MNSARSASSAAFGLVLLFLVLGTIVPSTSAHRILGIFTHIGGSHFHTFYPIMKDLADRGHNVTVLSYFAAKNPPPNYNERRFQGMPVINSSLELDIVPDRSWSTMYSEYLDLYELGDATCREVFQSTHIDDILREHEVQPFDLVITEVFDSDCVLGVIHLMRVPYVGLSSCVLMPWHHDRVSIPDLPSYVPTLFMDTSEQMTYAQRLRSWLVTKSMKLLYRTIEWNDNRLLAEKFGPGIPDVAKLASSVSLVLVNTHFSFHGPRPLSPQLVEIGGVHIKEAKPLPENLQTILDNSPQGVIVISWGSTVRASSLDPTKLHAILRVLAKIPLQIIWKWEDALLPNKPDNVHIQSWLPQRDVLCHPSVVLFWSHGGNLGTSESVHCGVPMVITPTGGDQFFNAAAAVNRGLARILPLTEITEGTVFGALNEVLKPEYKASAKHISQAFRDRPIGPLDTAVWWIEHVIVSGGFPLGRSHAADMSWFTYHSVDAILTVLAALGLVLWLVCWAIFGYRADNRKISRRGIDFGKSKKCK